MISHKWHQFITCSIIHVTSTRQMYFLNSDLAVTSGYVQCVIQRGIIQSETRPHCTEETWPWMEIWG